MYARRILTIGVLGALFGGVPAQGQTATLRLAASQGAIQPGEQFTVEAFIDNLPIELHGYQIGLTVTGGDSGEIAAAAIEDAVLVDHGDSNWVFREIADGGANVLSAGDARTPPRLFALPLDPGLGSLPPSERYLGTFVLEASSDASGEFEIGITPPDIADSGAGTILITTGGSVFPADVDDPAVIPVLANALAMSVQSVGVPTVSEWGLAVLALLIVSVGILVCRKKLAVMSH